MNCYEKNKQEEFIIPDDIINQTGNELLIYCCIIAGEAKFKRNNSGKKCFIADLNVYNSIIGGKNRKTLSKNKKNFITYLNKYFNYTGIYKKEPVLVYPDRKFTEKIGKYAIIYYDEFKRIFDSNVSIRIKCGSLKMLCFIRLRMKKRGYGRNTQRDIKQNPRYYKCLNSDFYTICRKEDTMKRYFTLLDNLNILRFCRAGLPINTFGCRYMYITDYSANWEDEIKAAVEKEDKQRKEIMMKKISNMRAKAEECLEIERIMNYIDDKDDNIE